MNRAVAGWQIAYASVIGKSHIDEGLPNQDAVFLDVSPDRRCFVIAVCDGAGSARHAKTGARHFSDRIGRGLLALTNAIDTGQIDGKSKNLINDRILGIIAEARQELDPTGLRLRDYAANLMAVAMGPAWGIRVHLGDAILLKSCFAETAEGKVDYFSDALMTQQDRAEYANETHFLTQHDWARHMIWDFLDPRGQEDLYALMSDGAGDIALENTPDGADRKVFRGFMAPMINAVLRENAKARDEIIGAVLADSQTFRLTGDDKTLVLLMRDRCFEYTETEPLIEDTRAPPQSTDSSTIPSTPEHAAPSTHNQTHIAAPMAEPVIALPGQLPILAHRPRPAAPPITDSPGRPPPAAPSSSKRKGAVADRNSDIFWKALLFLECIAIAAMLALLLKPTYEWISARAKTGKDAKIRVNEASGTNGAIQMSTVADGDSATTETTVEVVPPASLTDGRLSASASHHAPLAETLPKPRKLQFATDEPTMPMAIDESAESQAQYTDAAGYTDSRLGLPTTEADSVDRNDVGNPLNVSGSVDDH